MTNSATIKTVILVLLIPISLIIASQIHVGNRWPDMLGGLFNLDYRPSRIFAHYFNAGLIYLAGTWTLFLVFKWKIPKAFKALTIIVSSVFVFQLIRFMLASAPMPQPVERHELVVPKVTLPEEN